MNERPYKYRVVSVGPYRHVEITGLQPTDEVELNELLRTMQQKHGWPPALQVFVGPREEATALAGSSGLAAYNSYVTKIRVGPHRTDVHVTPWAKDSLS